MQQQDINGVLLLDKPPGITSNAALQIVKKIFHAKKAGHTGSLDPIASGMLVICFGKATKLSSFLLEADKKYQVTCKLGATTTTGDSEGEIVAQVASVNITKRQIQKILPKFTGTITQIPSMYSAIKHQGQPLYKLARQGITVERKPRTIDIHDLSLLNLQQNILDLKIICSKGTYVRTLVEDIGNELGCGAHVIALRRLQVADFSAENMLTIEKIKKIASEQGQEGIQALLLPVESIVAHLPELLISEAAEYYVRQGQAVILPYAPTEGMLCLRTQQGKFLGIGEVLPDGKVAPRHIIN